MTARMAKMAKTWTFLLAVAMAVAAGGCSRDREPGPHTWRLSHITSATSPWHRGAEEFASRVHAELPDFEVQVYPFGQLANGDQKTELQMVMGGAIDVLLVSPIVLAQYLDPRFDVLNLPFLFPDHATARAVVGHGPFTDELTGLLGQKMLVPLAWGVNGFRQLTTSGREVRTPEDLQGLKVRVAGSRLFQDIFSAFGATGVSMSFGELFTSLEQGVVDAQENPLSIIESARLYEVQDHVTLWNYVYDPIVLVVSVPVWDELTREEKGVVLRAAREAMDFEADLVEREDEELPGRLAEQGMTVVRPTPEELDGLRAAVESVHARYRPRVGPQLYDLLRAAIDAYRPPQLPTAEDASEEAPTPAPDEQAPVALGAAAPPVPPSEDPAPSPAPDDAPSAVRVIDE